MKTQQKISDVLLITSIISGSTIVMPYDNFSYVPNEYENSLYKSGSSLIDNEYKQMRSPQYTENEKVEIVLNFAQKMSENLIELDPDISLLVDQHFWELF